MASQAAHSGPSVSVAMCTYQGETYLAEQLETVAQQRRPPDEVVISDDASTDATLEIVEDFARWAPFPVEVRVNPGRVGSTKNFEKAIGLCRGEIIVLADQDDLWLPTKLERLTHVFEASPELAGVFGDADLVGPGLHVIEATLWQVVGFGPSQRSHFSRGTGYRVLANANVATGATMAFRSRYRPLLLPIPPAWVQDAWIALLLSCVADVRPVPERLIRYRVHPEQQIGLPVSETVPEARLRGIVRRLREDEREGMVEWEERFTEVVRILRHHSSSFPPRRGAVAFLEGKARHLRARGEIERRGRLRVAATELVSGRYHAYSRGLRSAAKDVLLLDVRATTS